MLIRPWSLYSWSAVTWQVPDDPTVWPAFACAGAYVRDDDAQIDASLAHGDTVWTGDIDGQAVGFGWEWVELRRGVVMLRDPNCIITNVNFIVPEYRFSDALVKIVQSNLVAHALPWQAAVQDELRAHRMSTQRKTARPAHRARTETASVWRKAA